MGNRLLKEEPSKEWITLFVRYLRLEVQALADDENLNRNASANELVSGCPSG